MVATGRNVSAAFKFEVRNSDFEMIGSRDAKVLNRQGAILHSKSKFEIRNSKLALLFPRNDFA